jgi:hypothetical protein
MRTQLKELALEVNDSLSEYIVVHDTLIQKSSSFLDIFRTINFEELGNKTQVVFSKLKTQQRQIQELKTDLTDEIEIEFANCLLSYTEALVNTVSLLNKMLSDLLEKSKGGKGKISFKDHLDNDKQYKSSIEDYQSFGQKLNDLYKKL